MIVERINSQDWKDQWVEKIYPLTFSAHRPKGLEKISYALIVKDAGQLVGFTTAIELDGETVYWQFGGVPHDLKKTFKVMSIYEKLINWEKEHHKRITTRIENDNMPMLKMAMACGFKIIGTWNFNNKIYLELLNEFGGK